MSARFALVVRAALLLCLVLAAPASAELRGTDVLNDLGGAAAAGDVNGDGIADLAAGPRVRFGMRDGVPAATDPGFTVANAVPASEPSLSAAGDLDGDGFDDVFSSTPTETWVVYGAAATSQVVLTPGARVTRIAGGSAQRAFDLDGDGRDELIVRSTGAQQAWAIVRGGARVPEITTAAAGARLSLVPTVRNCDPTYVVIPWTNIRYRSGTRCVDSAPAVQAPGDVNGDGRADLFFPDNADAETRDFWRGYGEVWHGRDPMPPSLNTRALGTDGVARVNVPATAAGPAVPGAARVPTTAGPIGDVTGDGRADLVVQPMTQGEFWILPGRSGTAAYDATAAARITVPAPAPTSLGRPDEVHPLPVGDVDGDGVRDIGVFGPASVATFRLAIRAGVRSPGGTAPVLVAGVPGVDGVAPFTTSSSMARPVGDIDDDGRPDLAIGSLSCPGAFVMIASHRADRAAPRLRQDCGSTRSQSVSPQSVQPGAVQTRTVALIDPATVRFEVRQGGSLVTAEERDLPGGVSKVSWNATAGGQPLAVGSYVLRLIPRDGAGNVGAAVDVPFDVGEPPAPVTTLTLTKTTPTTPDVVTLALGHCEPGARTVTSVTVPAGWTQVSGPAAPFAMTPPSATQCAATELVLRRGAGAASGDAVVTPQFGPSVRVALSGTPDGVTLQQVSATTDRVTVRVTNTGPAFDVADFALPAGWVIAERIGINQKSVPHGESQLILVRGTADGELVFTYTAGAPGWQPPARLALTGAQPSEARFAITPATAEIVAVYGKTGRKTFTVTNIGQQAGPVGLLFLQGSSFSHEIETTTCRAGGTPVVIPAGGTCAVTVAFRPRLGNAYAPTELYADTGVARITFRAKYY